MSRVNCLCNMNGDIKMNKQYLRLLLILVMVFLMPISARAGIKIESYSLNSLLNTSRGLKVPGTTSDAPGNLSSPGIAGKLIPLKVKFRSIADTTLNPFSLLVLMNDFDIFQEVPPAVEGTPLAFPNPFRQSTGTTIGYTLSKPMDITIQIFNMAGHKIFDRDYASGTDGAVYGYNPLRLDSSTFPGYTLPSGIYLLYIIHNEKVLGHGKLAIIP